MNAYSQLRAYLEWLLNHSLQSGVLVLLVLLIQWVFRRQLTNRWRFALWWIVLARLLLPFNPESAISLFNIFHPNFHLEGPHNPVLAQISRPGESKTEGSTQPAAPPSSTLLPPIHADPAMEPDTVPPAPSVETRAFSLGST